MKIAIIGAGNMGGALAGAVDTSVHSLIVANPSEGKLEALKANNPSIGVTTSNTQAAAGADVIILAVKPWVLPSVIDELRPALRAAKTVISVVAGVEAADLASAIGEGAPVCYYMIPNTAVAVGEGMTFVSSCGASSGTDAMLEELLARTGHIMFVEPRQMTAGMAVASCGIAYAMRYIRAAAEGGVELGLTPSMATEAVARTLRGAAALLEAHGMHPEQEVDRVTTPGGVTIRGLNAMEAAGFTAAVIAGIKASKP